MGRPRKKIDAEQVEKLAGIHCTMTEIATVVGCSVDTLERRFADVIKRGRDAGKASLRRKQFELAMSGNPALLIWLGKQLLEQREPRAPIEDVAAPAPRSPLMSDEEISRRIQTLIERTQSVVAWPPVSTTEGPPGRPS